MKRVALAALLLLGAAAPRSPLYYQDPDGKPFYAAGPKQTADGRSYVPVYDDAAPVKAQAPAPEKKNGHRRILYYRAPMGPETSPVPKKDSMNMDYIPVYANDGENAGTVTVSPARIQELGVRTAPVELRPTLSRTIRATGTLQFDERRLAAVTTRVSGWIEHLNVAATGDPVRRGQVLAEIYSPDLVASEQEYLVASRMGGGVAAAALERLRALDVPADEIARLRRTGRVAQRVAIRAPADGVVLQKTAVAGMRVSPDQPLYRTASLAPMWLIAEVQEQDLGAVRPGEHVRARFVAFPGRTFAGTVDFIYPSLSAGTRTGRVRIVMPNADAALRAGMYAEVAIDVPAASGPVLAVPSSAILDSGTQHVALVARGEGRFEPRHVRVGASGDGFTQVLTGLHAGERVVVSANFLIDAESNLRAALQTFTAPKEPVSMGSKAP